MVRPEGNGYTTQYIMEPTGAETRPLRFETIYFMVAMLIYSWRIHNTLTAYSNHHLCECSDALLFLNAVLLKTICTIVCPKVASNVRYAKYAALTGDILANTHYDINIPIFLTRKRTLSAYNMPALILYQRIKLRSFSMNTMYSACDIYLQ